MSGLFGGRKKIKVPKLPELPKLSDPAADEKARQLLAAENKAKGRRASLLTGSKGVPEEATRKKRLLGG